METDILEATYKLSQMHSVFADITWIPGFGIDYELSGPRLSLLLWDPRRKMYGSSQALDKRIADARKVGPVGDAIGEMFAHAKAALEREYERRQSPPTRETVRVGDRLAYGDLIWTVEQVNTDEGLVTVKNGEDTMTVLVSVFDWWPRP